MALGEEHIPEPELLCLLLQVVDNGRVVIPSLRALTDLRLQDGIGWNTFLLDELCDDV